MSLEKYLSDPDMYITSVPSQQDLAAPEPRPVSIDGTDRGYGSTRGSSSRSSGGKSGMSPGEIAGLVIGLLAGLGILGALAYFVGYKKLYQTHKATSYKRNVIPEGPSELQLSSQGGNDMAVVFVRTVLQRARTVQPEVVGSRVAAAAVAAAAAQPWHVWGACSVLGASCDSQTAGLCSMWFV